MTHIIAVTNKVPPHPCLSDDSNQRHTSVRHLVGVVALFALEKQDSKIVIRFLLFMPHLLVIGFPVHHSVMTPAT